MFSNVSALFNELLINHLQDPDASVEAEVPESVLAAAEAGEVFITPESGRCRFVYYKYVLPKVWNHLLNLVLDVLDISPPVRWGLLDFMYALRFLILILRLLIHLRLLHFRVPRRHPRRHLRQTSTRTSRLQWAAPGLNSEPQIAVGSAGPQPGGCGLGNAGPQPGGSGADWATPDLTRGPPERSGQRRTSAARRCVRYMSEKNVRKNVRRYVRRNVRKYVKRNVRRYVKRYVRNMPDKNVRRYVRRNVRRFVKR